MNEGSSFSHRAVTVVNQGELYVPVSEPSKHETNKPCHRRQPELAPFVALICFLFISTILLFL